MEKTMSECLSDLAKKYGDKTAIVFKHEKLTYKQLEYYSDRIMTFYMKEGIKKGTHVGLWSTNTVPWVLHYAALCKIGAVVVLMNTYLRKDELAQMINYADITHLCYGQGFRDVSYEECLHELTKEDVPYLRKVYPIGNELDSNFIHNIKKEEQKSDNLKEIKGLVSPNDPINIIFTSGTLSNPKGVMTNAYQMLTLSEEVIFHMHLNEDSRICVALPLYHCYGLSTNLLSGLNAGATMYLLECFKSISVLECITRNQCTVFNGVTTMFLAMMKHSRRSEYEVNSLITGTVAGSYVPSKDFIEISRDFAIPNLQMSYGQTEAAAGITFSDYNEILESKSKHVGKPIRGLNLRIGEPNSEKMMENGCAGEIQVKGYSVMSGYYKMEEESRKMFTHDGWMKTGDMGYIDNEGNVHITGRLKELIIRSGENISPVEVEGCIRNYPGIFDVKVIGIPAEVIQERVVACIVKRDDCEFEEKLFIEYLKKHLAIFKIPDLILYFDVFPIGMTGKVNTKELKKHVMDMAK